MTGKKGSSGSHLVSSDTLKRQPIKKNQSSTNSPNKSENKVESQNPKLYPELDIENDCDNDDHKRLLSETSEENLPAPKSFKNKSPKVENLYPNIAKDKHYIDSKSSTTDSEKKQYPQHVSLFFSKYIVCFIIVLIVLIAFPFLYFSQSPKISQSGETVINVKELLERMQKEFQNQPEKTFGIIRRALKEVVNITREPDAPATILLLVNKEAKHIGLDFSKSLAHKIVGENYILIEEDVYLNRNPNIVKQNIDDKINQMLTHENLNVILVDKFERIPVKAAMLFHNYCDHENALYKRTVYLLVLSMDSNLPENSGSKYMDLAAHKRLSNLWRDMSSDYFDSLITRLTVNVVNIK